MFYANCIGDRVRNAKHNNFEALVFLKGNLQLLDEKSLSAQLDMEADDENEDEN
jgi:hypothetical protein